MAAAVLGCRTPISPRDVRNATDEDGWLRASGEIAHWLSETATKTPRGLAWAPDPDKPNATEVNLYSGSAGVVLFLFEYAAATHDDRALDVAKLGANELVSGIPTQIGGENAGLYTGAAGLGFVLNESFRLTKDVKYEKAARLVVDLLERDAKYVGAGIEWNETHDIMSGAAGTGLFLLYAHLRMHDERALPMARQVGDRLIEVAIPDHGGLKWGLEPEYGRFLPNFSHGTAGVSYYLASLYELTRDKRYLSAAIAGAHYLTQVGELRAGGFRVFHADPDGLDRFYLGWCHGPAGTGRLFVKLWRATNDVRWKNLFQSCARTILTTQIPERADLGLWNNVGQCCGSAGIADFLLNASRLLDDNAYLAQAQSLTRDLLSRGTLDKRGLRFPHSEHRVKPTLIVAQTGHMQGAAGIGLWLLDLHAFATNRKPAIVLLDTPFE